MAHADEKKPPPEAPATIASEDTRRHFLKTVGVGGIGVGLAAVAAVPAAAFVAYPLAHSTVSGAAGFVKVGRSEAFKPGQPVKVDVFADKRDAWNRIVQMKIGSAWLLRQGAELRAYTTVCPHLGCAVDFEADGAKFKCPCHQSVFALDGKVEGGPAPRTMDTLELEEKDGVVSIRYARFRQGIADKEAI